MVFGGIWFPFVVLWWYGGVSWSLVSRCLVVYGGPWWSLMVLWWYGGPWWYGGVSRCVVVVSGMVVVFWC